MREQAADKWFYTYIAASRTHVLYTGMTGDLRRRMFEHRSRAKGGFAAACHCDRLVWFERYATPGGAIAREKQLKGWTRAKKLGVIQANNPAWIDFAEEWFQTQRPPHTHHESESS